MTPGLAAHPQGLQVAQKEAQIRLLEGRLRQTDIAGSSQNHVLLEALRDKAEARPELQALIHNVQQGMGPPGVPRHPGLPPPPRRPSIPRAPQKPQSDPQERWEGGHLPCTPWVGGLTPSSLLPHREWLCQHG